MRAGAASANAGYRSPRVVLIPGVLGSELTDTSLTPTQARQLCERNLGLLGRFLRGSALYPCDKRPETLWGGVGSLHWIFNPEAWGLRMRSGNGYDVPGQVRAGGLVDIDLRLGRRRVAVQPYTGLLRALRRSGAEVLCLPLRLAPLPHPQCDHPAGADPATVVRRRPDTATWRRCPKGIGSPSSVTAWAACSRATSSSHRDATAGECFGR